MSDVVISAEGLGKKFLIGHQSAERENYTALRDVIVRSLKGLGQSARDLFRGRQIIAGDEIEEFWALNDVSFEITRGEVIGIIGRNGAGKSTLLKILSRITEPSKGRVTIKGRVASLLEVGTGFHPELTGRENIYLNGAILGMSRAEIKRKFDEIVAFAEVERFLDTPVKRYSSGMYVRLAFAVAAHLEPEILIVDEVLAVGDSEFQKKCLGQMKDVAGHGRTVLFVSHNLGAVSSLCSSCIWLAGGQIRSIGRVEDIVSEFSNRVNDPEPKIQTTLSGKKDELNTELQWDPEKRILTYEVRLNLMRAEKLTALHIFLQTSTSRRAMIIDLIPDGEAALQAVRGLNTYRGRADLSKLSTDHYTVGVHAVTSVGPITDWAVTHLHIRNPRSRYAIDYQGPLTI